PDAADQSFPPSPAADAASRLSLPSVTSPLHFSTPSSPAPPLPASPPAAAARWRCAVLPCHCAAAHARPCSCSSSSNAGNSRLKKTTRLLQPGHGVGPGCPDGSSA
ncbi:hypothetical protein Tsubulata_028513, partial [Turnera subulata]